MNKKIKLKKLNKKMKFKILKLKIMLIMKL